MEAKLPIFAVSSQQNPGSILTDPDGKAMRVTRNLTADQVRELAPQFFMAVMAHVPPETEVHWCEAEYAPTN